MLTYLIRRVLYAIPILAGVNLLTFALFFFVNSPDDMAHAQLGEKRVTKEAVEKWKAERGYDRPMFLNQAMTGPERFTETVFFKKSVTLFRFEFGASEDGRDINFDIGQRMWPSLAIAVPSFLVGLLFYVSFALLLAYFRATRLDFIGVVVCVTAMSISGLFYIIGGQWLVSKLWHWVPISGYADGLTGWRFVVLPALIGIIGGIGASARMYRTIFLEEMGKDYVRTARAKGLPESRVLFGHVLRNGLIPILTGVVVAIPSLFIGSLVMESFFGIPGLGSYTIEAIQSQDFQIVRAMVFLGSVLYIIGLILTDVSYTLADPRVRLH
jgi:peptide/nickel transport system permease protein